MAYICGGVKCTAFVDLTVIVDFCSGSGDGGVVLSVGVVVESLHGHFPYIGLQEIHVWLSVGY